MELQRGTPDRVLQTLCRSAALDVENALANPDQTMKAVRRSDFLILEEQAAHIWIKREAGQNNICAIETERLCIAAYLQRSDVYLAMQSIHGDSHVAIAKRDDRADFSALIAWAAREISLANAT